MKAFDVCANCEEDDERVYPSYSYASFERQRWFIKMNAE